MIGKCPRCHGVIVYDRHDSDIVHECNSNIKTLDNESVPVMGTYTDESTGSVVTVDAFGVMMQGHLNTNDFLNNNKELNEFGDNKATHRIRPHSEYIKLK